MRPLGPNRREWIVFKRSRGSSHFYTVSLVFYNFLFLYAFSKTVQRLYRLEAFRFRLRERRDHGRRQMDMSATGKKRESGKGKENRYRSEISRKHGVVVVVVVFQR